MFFFGIQASKRWTGRNALPFVICALNERKGTYLVVGVPCPDKEGDVEKTAFHRIFAVAAEQINARIRLDRFDTSVMEIGKDDIFRFIDHLYEVMAS